MAHAIVEWPDGTYTPLNDEFDYEVALVNCLNGKRDS